MIVCAVCVNHYLKRDSFIVIKNKTKNININILYDKIYWLRVFIFLIF